MKSLLMPLMCAAALALPMFSSKAAAGVAGKTYNAAVISTAAAFIETVVAFDEEGGVSTDFGGGEYEELFDLGVFSLFTFTLTDDEDEEFQVELIGIQLDTIMLARGTDNDNIEYFAFGEEVVEEEN